VTTSSVDAVGVDPARVVHSVLSPATLQEAVARAHPIARPTGCELVKLGMNDTYVLRTPRQRYVLRVYRAGWRRPDEIDYELALLAHLAARGVPVAAAVPTADGRLSLPVLAPEGPRRAALFAFVPGAPLRWRDEAGSRLAGRLLGDVHAAADDFQDPPGCSRLLDVDHLIDRPLAALRPFLEHRPRDRAYLDGLAVRLKDRVRAAAEGGLDWGPCHGDFGAKNLHLHQGVLRVFDFDFCGAGWRAYDLLPARWQAAERRSTGMWEAFLRGYRAARPLGHSDVAAVPMFAVLRHLWGMGLRSSEVPYRGISRLGSEYLDYRLAAFRRWEREHLP
jgi:Ser/Thr protein kinase RdoA (MazF antagonist)